MDYSDATDFHKVITGIVNETFAAMEYGIRGCAYGAGAKADEYKGRAYREYIQIALDEAVRDALDVMNKELYDYMIHRFGGYLAVIKKYFDVVDSVAIFQMPEYKTANLLMRHTLWEYIYNENNMVEYEEYKEWKAINGSESESESDESDNEGEGEEGEGEEGEGEGEGVTTTD